MEKLIMLIDIYEEKVVGVHSVGDKITEKDEARIISKQFGFIKRLVDSDKIDERKLDEYRGNDYDHFNRIETLIQILSIQDNPIEFLISYLK